MRHRQCFIAHRRKKPPENNRRCFITKICKEARVLSAGTPGAQQLERINVWSKSPLSAQEVYCFSVRLCDDLPDRDFECFDTEALTALAGLFVGKTGICDHDWSTDRQVARIFDAEVRREEGVSFILAHAYMLRSDKNADLIAEIEGGIKREVSVGCAMAKSRCSICGESYGSCMHRKGVAYDGKICLAVLSEPVDAYEFSFVAVPAQREAGVLKARREGTEMTLEELVRKSGASQLVKELQTLDEEAAFGRACRQSLEQEVVALGLLLDFGATEEVLKKSAAALDGNELKQWKLAMEEKRAQLFPVQTQLPGGKSADGSMEAAFMI